MRYDTEIIRSVVPMTDLAERYGVTVRRGMCCCPFHGERHPSMKLYKDGYHCFACGAHGDAISWVMHFDSVGFVEACERLCGWYGINAERTQEMPAEALRAALVNEYAAAKRKVKELAPKTPDDEPTEEFWKAIEERNRLADML